jgi:hypothetical protein
MIKSNKSPTNLNKDKNVHRNVVRGKKERTGGEIIVQEKGS